jgi:8-oxo-dGTP pyrophosphatase MutT (NUDIX family)
MTHPQNFRAYGVLLRAGKVMIAAEYIGRTFGWKFPGGGVEVHETPEEALVREFAEETGLAVELLEELHDPGTLISPWTGGPYSPIYFLVTADGEPVVPQHENVEISFMAPDVVLASTLVPMPEKIALRRALALVASRFV